MKFRSFLAVLAVVFAGAKGGVANTPPPPIPLLLPVVASDTPDALGNRWDTRVSFAYDASVPVTTFFYCGRIVDFRFVSPGERGELTVNFQRIMHGPGLVLFVPPSDIKRMAVQTFVHRNGSSTGAVIPGVRSTDLVFGETLHLIGIPVGADSRTLVRLYDLALTNDTDVVLRVYSPTGDLLATDNVHLVQPPADSIDVFPTYPAYAEYRPPVDAKGLSSISIDIEPLSPNRLIWAFATTTSNDTDAVSAVFPAR